MQFISVTSWGSILMKHLSLLISAKESMSARESVSLSLKWMFKIQISSEEFQSLLSVLSEWAYSSGLSINSKKQQTLCRHRSDTEKGKKEEKRKFCVLNFFSFLIPFRFRKLLLLSKPITLMFFFFFFGQLCVCSKQFS